jgi:hypothetical protein
LPPTAMPTSIRAGAGRGRGFSNASSTFSTLPPSTPELDEVEREDVVGVMLEGYGWPAVVGVTAERDERGEGGEESDDGETIKADDSTIKGTIFVSPSKRTISRACRGEIERVAYQLPLLPLRVPIRQSRFSITSSAHHQHRRNVSSASSSHNVHALPFPSAIQPQIPRSFSTNNASFRRNLLPLHYPPPAGPLPPSPTALPLPSSSPSYSSALSLPPPPPSTPSATSPKSSSSFMTRPRFLSLQSRRSTEPSLPSTFSSCSSWSAKGNRIDHISSPLPSDSPLLSPREPPRRPPRGMSIPFEAALAPPSVAAFPLTLPSRSLSRSGSQHRRQGAEDSKPQPDMGTRRGARRRGDKVDLDLLEGRMIRLKGAVAGAEGIAF